MAKIEVRFGDVALREVSLDKPSVMIGRSGRNDIAIDNMAVSRKHAKIYREGPRFIVEDLKSLNGTFVNNKKVSEWILSDNDRILIGKHTLVFIDERDQPVRGTAGAEGPSVEQTVILQTKKQRELLSKIQKSGPDKESGKVHCGVTIISGCSGQQDIELTKGLSVAGRDVHADIRLKGLFLGKGVFLISRRPSGFYISSSGGRTTTRVNGFPITDQQELRDGDMISVGRNKMQFYRKT